MACEYNPRARAYTGIQVRNPLSTASISYSDTYVESQEDKDLKAAGAELVNDLVHFPNHPTPSDLVLIEAVQNLVKFEI